jgi:predicted transcriptional regulator
VAETKNLLLRLDPELAEALQAIAAVEDRPVSEVVREAIRELVEGRRRDRQFQKRLRQSTRKYEALLGRLREGE